MTQQHKFADMHEKLLCIQEQQQPKDLELAKLRSEKDILTSRISNLLKDIESSNKCKSDLQKQLVDMTVRLDTISTAANTSTDVFRFEETIQKLQVSIP